MASTCVDIVGMPLESFLECTPAYPSYNWLGPRISFSCDIADNGASKEDVEKPEPEIETEETVDDSLEFEFLIDDPVSVMLPADELFYEGKLVPLQIVPERGIGECESNVLWNSMNAVKLGREVGIAGSDDPCEFSPKAPRCSSRWKELLGLKKEQNANVQHQKFSVADSTKFLKHFLHRKLRSSPDTDSLSLPLLRTYDSESVSSSSRRSISSSCLASDKQNHAKISSMLPFCSPPPVRLTKVTSPVAEDHVTARVGRSLTRTVPESGEMLTQRGSSVDSPRLNASGKVIFQGLERSSSSPSTFNGGPRPRPRRMVRPYSPNLRVTPVLNVPICTLRGSAMSVSILGFGPRFHPQKKEKDGYILMAKKLYNSSANNGITI